MTVTSNILKPNQFINDRYKVVTALNHGSFGSVSLAKDTWARNSLVAVKCINKQQDSSDAIDEAKEEIAIHKRLGHHKYICSLLDTFEDDIATYLVMEYCPEGDLYEAIRAGKGPGPSDVLDFMLQLIEAVEYAHSKGVYHRDIKPENILIASDGSVRLADWGLATTIRINSEFGVGSERYMAPELFDQKNIDSYDAEKVDIWSIGICLLNILFARNPFTSACQKDKLFLDFASSREALFDIFPSLSDDTFTALRYCLTLDPDNRFLDLFRDALYDVDLWTTDEDDDYYYYDDQDMSRDVSVSDVNPVEDAKSGSVSVRGPAASVSGVVPVTSISTISSNSVATSNPTTTTNTSSATSTTTTTPSTSTLDLEQKPATATLIASTTLTPTAPMPIAKPNMSTQDLASLATTAPLPKGTTSANEVFKYQHNHHHHPQHNPFSSNHHSHLNVPGAIFSTSTASIPLQHSIVPTSNNREPLRTPSVMSSEQLVSESMLSVAWSRTMQFTPPNPSFFADPRNSATFSGGNSKRDGEYLKRPVTNSIFNGIKTGVNKMVVSHIAEEDEENEEGKRGGKETVDNEEFDDDHGIFPMDEMESSMSSSSNSNSPNHHHRHLQDQDEEEFDSLYSSVPSLVASSLSSSSSSSDTDGNFGNSRGSKYSVSAVPAVGRKGGIGRAVGARESGSGGGEKVRGLGGVGKYSVSGGAAQATKAEMEVASPTSGNGNGAGEYYKAPFQQFGFGKSTWVAGKRNDDGVINDDDNKFDMYQMIDTLESSVYKPPSSSLSYKARTATRSSATLTPATNSTTQTTSSRTRTAKPTNKNGNKYYYNKNNLSAGRKPNSSNSTSSASTSSPLQPPPPSNNNKTDTPPAKPLYVPPSRRQWVSTWS